jgi:hypothetical protein
MQLRHTPEHCGSRGLQDQCVNGSAADASLLGHCGRSGIDSTAATAARTKQFPLRAGPQQLQAPPGSHHCSGSTRH